MEIPTSTDYGANGRETFLTDYLRVSETAWLSTSNEVQPGNHQHTKNVLGFVKLPAAIQGVGPDVSQSSQLLGFPGDCLQKFNLKVMKYEMGHISLRRNTH